MTSPLYSCTLLFSPPLLPPPLLSYSPQKKTFEIILHVGRVTSFQSWVAEKSCHGQTLINECFIFDYPSNFALHAILFQTVFDSRSASLSFPRSSKLVFQFWLRLQFTAGRWDSISLNFDSFYNWSLQFASSRSNRRLSIIFQLETWIVVN